MEPVLDKRNERLYTGRAIEKTFPGREGSAGPAGSKGKKR